MIHPAHANLYFTTFYGEGDQLFSYVPMGLKGFICMLMGE